MGGWFPPTSAQEIEVQVGGVEKALGGCLVLPSCGINHGKGLYYGHIAIEW